MAKEWVKWGKKRTAEEGGSCNWTETLSETYKSFGELKQKLAEQEIYKLAQVMRRYSLLELS